MSFLKKNYVLIANLALSALLIPFDSMAQPAAKSSPNILFIIMDDVGIDQMKSFGYGNLGPSMPIVDAVAEQGIKFRNHWTMPACSPSRATFFEGRFPFRSQVYGALGTTDLANSMVSPFDVTVPKLLKKANYQSGLFGKFHLALQGNNPFADGMVNSLGFDYFFGWTDKTGDPSSIDSTAGGVAQAGKFTCGYVPGASDGGADSGACYTSAKTCQSLTGTAENPPGRICRDQGGIFDPGKACEVNNAPAYIDFSRYNGHFVSPLMISSSNGLIENIPTTDKRARTFRGVSLVDEAIRWINQQPANKPWMATVSFASDHTPLQQPPINLLKKPVLPANNFNCTNTGEWQVLSNQMIEAMDTEIGRLLSSIGLATLAADGSLIYQPAATNTMIVIVGDNGSLGQTVKLPFDPTRAKGTAYQTGVWTPLIVSGPLVNGANRNVESMTNATDIYQLFGEIAGLDVHKLVPWTVDSQSLLPYLRNPNQKPIRSWNYSQIDLNMQANGGLNGPCVIGNSCTHIPIDKSVCEDNNGIWWGAGATDPSTTGLPAEGLQYCCQVDIWKKNNNQPLVSISPQGASTIRNSQFKLVKNSVKNYDATSNQCVDTKSYEFYQVDQNPNNPSIDRADLNLTANGTAGLTSTQKLNYDALYARLDALEKSEPQCPGDGNLDNVVDKKDLDEWKKYAFQTPQKGLSSWYDFNLDGLTDQSDLAIIKANLGKRCK